MELGGGGKGFVGAYTPVIPPIWPPSIVGAMIGLSVNAIVLVGEISGISVCVEFNVSDVVGNSCGIYILQEIGIIPIDSKVRMKMVRICWV